ncbi:D-3-phosphoglycerate dehydrogenase [Lachnospiraceae bacterium TWA4]|nr:D-3-phosphoglycerate dehydrogenase [Lachnospiraceae bacterium TWA4]
MKNVLVTLPVKENHKQLLEQAAGTRAKFIYSKEVKSLENIQGLIGNISPNLIKGSSLEWIQLNSAGQDSYVVPGILPEGCILKNAVGAYGRTVSEHMLALTFALIRKFPQYSRNQQAHQWKDEGSVISIEGSTILVLGLGDIGGSYAKKVKALGAYVLGVRHLNKPKPEYLDEQYTLEALPELVQRADIIASVLPSTKETKHLFNKELLEKCKKGAYLINCGRGDSVNLDALKFALDEKILAGAGLDVTEPEPLNEDHALWDYENVLITPHVAGGFHLQQTFDAIIELAGKHLNEWLGENDG